MSSIGKKRKKAKSKGTVLSLSSFLSNGEVAGKEVAQIARIVRNAEANSDKGVETMIVELPRAPRAIRCLENDGCIPTQPPFVAFINNLPFDVHEDEIRRHFNALQIKSLRLPRDESNVNRTRGFAYLEFTKREDLIDLLKMTEPVLRQRRLRIEISTDHDGYYNACKRWATDGGHGDNNARREKTSNNYWRNSSNRLHAGGDWTGGREIIEGGNRNKRGSRHQQIYRLGTESVRPRLQLNPRTLPLPNIVNECAKNMLNQKMPASKPNDGTGISQKSNKIDIACTDDYGQPKPTETTQKEKQVEELLGRIRLRGRLKEERYGLPNVQIRERTKYNCFDNDMSRPRLMLKPRTVPIPEIVPY